MTYDDVIKYIKGRYHFRTQEEVTRNERRLTEIFEELNKEEERKTTEKEHHRPRLSDNLLRGILREHPARREEEHTIEYPVRARQAKERGENVTPYQAKDGTSRYARQDSRGRWRDTERGTFARVSRK